jgi:hypothetical protein
LSKVDDSSKGGHLLKRMRDAFTRWILKVSLLAGIFRRGGSVKACGARDDAGVHEYMRVPTNARKGDSYKKSQSRLDHVVRSVNGDIAYCHFFSGK